MIGFMKKVHLLLILIIVASLPLSGLTPAFRLMSDLNIYPFFYEPVSGMKGIAFSGQLKPGIILNRFTLALSVSDSYFSLSRLNIPQENYGAWNQLQSHLIFLAEIHRFFELEAGAGGIWYRSSFNTGNTGSYTENKGGPSFILNAAIRFPFPYFYLSVKNSLDLLIDSTGVIPSYLGGICFNFHPRIRWMTLYVELSGMPWNYRSPPYSVDTGFFVWGTGVSIDLRIPAKTRPETRITEKDETSDQTSPSDQKKTEKQEAPETGTAESEKRALQLFSQIKTGSDFIWKGSFFSESSSELLPSSFAEMDALVYWMNAHPSLKLDITGYAFYTGNSISELKLCMGRAQSVKNYLVRAGISAARIRPGTDGIIIGIYGDQNKKPYLKLIFREAK
jgi:outer membrane protein OmpA-like peptidoglycan-associated protein